jgi:outer membrane protein assembly factor BamB
VDSITLKAYETLSGKEQWSTSLKGKVPIGWIPIERSGVLIAVQQEKKETHMTDLDIKTGKKLWETTSKCNAGLDNPPLPILVLS